MEIPPQDLGHFLAPTTTFWKTDVILDQDRIDAFLDTYIEKVNGRFDTTGLKGADLYLYSGHLPAGHHLVRYGMGTVSAAG